MPPSPARSRRESRPVRRTLPHEFPLAAYCLRLFHVAIPQRGSQLRLDQRLVVRTIAIHKLADDNLARQAESYLAGWCAMPHFAFFFVVLHGVQSVAQLIASLIKRWTRRNDLDKR